MTILEHPKGPSHQDYRCEGRPSFKLVSSPPSASFYIPDWRQAGKYRLSNGGVENPTLLIILVRNPD
jgi:hypothetical protein